jgi:hypothetical protein
MDFQQYARVIWRFKPLVLLGLVLALTLALLSTVHVTRHGATYRDPELWSSTMRLLVTQKGFPEGRLYAQEPTQGAEGNGAPITTPSSKKGFPLVDPGRFNTLAIIYSELATSDPIRQLMRRDGPYRGQIIATPLRDEQSGTLLPMIDLAAISTSPVEAMSLVQRGSRALSTYIEAEQRANKVPDADRVVIQPIVEPRGARLFQPRSKTMPIVIFLVVMFAILGLAFLLENLRPRDRERRSPRKDDVVEEVARRRTA